MLLTAAWTLGIAFVTFSYGCAIAGMIFPLQFAGFCESLGARAATAQYFENYYHRNPTPENLYLTLDKYIQANNNKKVIEYFEKLYFDNNSDYNTLVAKFNGELINAAERKEEFALTGNEDSRLKENYIGALLKQKRDGDAKSFYTDFCRSVSLQYPNRAFFVFVKADKQGLCSEQFDEYFSQFQDAYTVATTAVPPLGNKERIRPLFFLAEGAYYLSDISWQTYQSAYLQLPFVK